MSENINPKEMPHELLLRRHNLSVNDLSSHAKQMKKDFDRTLRAVISKSSNGIVTITSATKSKIDTYDRYICDGIFEYLENEEINSTSENEVEKVKMDAQREEQMDKLENSEDTPNDSIVTPNNTENSENKDVKSKARIGFFDWQ